MRAYFCVTANLQAFGSKRFHFTIELKISYSVRFGLDLLISFGSTVQNWNCDNPINGNGTCDYEGAFQNEGSFQKKPSTLIMCILQCSTNANATEQG